MPRADKTKQYDYLIRYVNEAAEARLPLIAMCERAILAYKQCPLRNTYKENADKYCQNIGNGNPELYKCLKHLCKTIPDATNDTVKTISYLMPQKWFLDITERLMTGDNKGYIILVCVTLAYMVVTLSLGSVGIRFKNNE